MSIIIDMLIIFLFNKAIEKNKWFIKMLHYSFEFWGVFTL